MARVLVSCFASRRGGVGRMVDFAVACLRRAGHEPVLAWYEHYSRAPRLSVPIWALPLRRPALRRAADPRGGETVAIGAWLPELEFTHYLPTRHWRELIASCAANLAVSGNCLAASPFALSRAPFMAWVATAWDEDRKDRVRGFPACRRVLDRLVVHPATARLERRILRAGKVFAISAHTAGALSRIAGGAPVPVIPVPVEPCGDGSGLPGPVAGRIGFAGRLEDPRKNVGLLLDAIARARAGGAAVTGLLLGAGDPERWRGPIAARGLEGAVEVLGYFDRREAFTEALRSLDLFVIPSYQEGLCIAALEAMACGCPVVSTRCGGPEDFVVEGVTGFWTDATPEAMAAAILRVVADRPLRASLSREARASVRRGFAAADTERALMAGLRATFPGAGL